jgi:hypothetical protein
MIAAAAQVGSVKLAFAIALHTDPSRHRDKKAVTFPPWLLKQTLPDGLMSFAAIPIFEFIEIAQTNGSIPVILSLY